MDIAAWLDGLGLRRYEEAFRANHISWELLKTLSSDDLRQLGVASLGHRKVMLAAIADLPGSSNAPTPASRAAVRPEAERRQLTVMFVDLVGSTALSAGLDPEEMREVLRDYLDAVAAAIARFDGHVARYLGDGVLAYFGFPKAHEDDAERAVRAGLDALNAVGRLHTPHCAPLAARVGIATGLVVVGDLIGEGAAQEQVVVGDTPNLAARLQALAEPGAVVVAPGTRRLLGALFEFGDLGDHVLKGFTEPVRAWRVLGPGRTAGRFEAREAAVGLAPLVGRNEELALLLNRWERTRKGEGQVVLLSGEPGIGKSRLAHALRERLVGESHQPLRYQCSPYHAGTALHPVIEQLERAADFGRNDSDEDKLAKLEAMLAPSMQDRGLVVPLLAALLVVREPHPPLELTPQRRKELTLEALVDQLASLAAGTPVLMVLEDAHWSDPTTLELFGRAIERARHLRVLIVVTFRPEFVPPWLGHAHATTLALDRLGRMEAAALVERISNRRSLPDAVVEQILAKADGVPLFVEELTKAVVESSLLDGAGDREGLLPTLSVPDTLHASLLARLDRLAPVREVAQVAACIGREFSYELLAAVAPVVGDELRQALERLTEAELVFRRGMPPEGIYSFKHALVQDAAYHSLLKSRRRQLHARIARVLEERFSAVAETQPEVLARHCTEGGLAARAVAYWREAGQLAARRSAMADAVKHFEAALALLAALPAGLDRSRTELELQIALGVVLNVAKGWASPEMGRAYARARELCGEVNDGRLSCSALYGLCMFHHNRAELDAALERAEELLRLGKERGDTAVALVAHRAAGIVLLFRGDPSAAALHLERVRADYNWREHALPLFVPHDTGVIGRIFLAWTTQLLGHADRALALSLEAATMAAQVARPFTTTAFALHVGCVLHQIRGERALVEKRSAALVALAREQGFPHFVGTGTFFRGWAMAASGTVEEGITEMRRGLAAKRATGAEIKVPYYLGLLAAAETAAGRPAAALPLLGEALEKVEGTYERWFAAELWRLRGEALLRANLEGLSRAEECFRKARDLAEAQGAKWWELRAATSLARLWGEKGERQRGRDLLAPVRARFIAGSDTPILRQADAILSALS